MTSEVQSKIAKKMKIFSLVLPITSQIILRLLHTCTCWHREKRPEGQLKLFKNTTVTKEKHWEDKSDKMRVLVCQVTPRWLVKCWILFLFLQTIQAVQPDVVLVELCKSRVDILKYDEEFLLREAKNIDMQKLRLAIKQVSTIHFKLIIIHCDIHVWLAHGQFTILNE